jgi:hypothetical protein
MCRAYLNYSLLKSLYFNLNNHFLVIVLYTTIYITGSFTLKALFLIPLIPIIISLIKTFILPALRVLT